MTENKVKTQTREWQGYLEAKEYKPSYCIDLVNIMSQGRGIETFNSQKNISRQTFYVWLKQNDEFKLAYSISKEKARLYMTNMLHDYSVECPGSQQEAGSPKLNMKAFNAIMRYSLDIPDERLLVIDGIGEGDSKSQMRIVLEALSAGLITSTEAHKIAQVLDINARITESSELSKKIEMLEAALSSGVKSDEFKEEA